jgi:hypothetical protein
MYRLTELEGLREAIKQDDAEGGDHHLTQVITSLTVPNRTRI